MPLMVHNTLSRKKEPFHKRPPAEVSMYVCGPTVYKPSHIGHMVGPVIFDTVKRFLVYLGYKVKWIVNITDVDDKLIARAAELKSTVRELAARMTTDYLENLKRLNVAGIDEMPCATDHIPDMISMIERLIAKGHAYAAGGDVYFDVTRDEDYGKLCNRDPEQLEAGHRIEMTDRKRNPGDFALWKGVKPDEPADVRWESPWGPGRPGWHIECSAMSTRLLGETLDIHGGGLDLKFPHHENELAQSESATGKLFAHVWMHNGLLELKDPETGKPAKMAGSVGNVLNVEEALKHISGEALRFFLLGTQYRSPVDLGVWNHKTKEIPSAILNAARAYETFYRFEERYQRVTGQSFVSLVAPERYEERKYINPVYNEMRQRFLDHMNDDFNTGGAVGVLFELVSAINRLADTGKVEDLAARKSEAIMDFTEGAGLLKELGQILGLFFESPRTSLGGDDAMVAGLMQLLIDLRNNLRGEAKKIAAKDDPTKKALFEQTDIIRKRLAELHVTLEDRPAGTTWRVG